LSQSFFDFEQELSPLDTCITGFTFPFSPQNDKKSQEIWRHREMWLFDVEYQFLKNLRHWTHFTKTFGKLCKVESHVVGNYDVEIGKCENNA
jgi:hypothetical protein